MSPRPEWTDENERLLLFWRQRAIDDANDHRRAFSLENSKRNVLSIPPVLIPSVLVFVSQLVPGPVPTALNAVLMVVSALCSALNTHLNLGKLTTKHNHYAANFTDLVTSIDAQLVLPRGNRKPYADFCSKIQTKIRVLNKDAPATNNADWPWCFVSRKYKKEKEFECPPFEAVLQSQGRAAAAASGLGVGGAEHVAVSDTNK